MRGPGTHTGEGVHAGEGDFCAVEGAQVKGKVQVGAPQCPDTGEEGLMPLRELLSPSWEDDLPTLSQTPGTWGATSREASWGSGTVHSEGSRWSLWTPPSDPGRYTSICKMRSSLEGSTESLCLPSQSPPCCSRVPAPRVDPVRLGVAGALRRGGC